MTYGVVSKYLRLPESDYKYDKNKRYLYVKNGFFDIVNIFYPVPAFFKFTEMNVLYLIGIYRIISLGLWYSWFVHYIFAMWTGLGIMAGAHRLWSHRSYRAKLPLRIFLMLGQTMCAQYTIYSWARGHRIHHKYPDTDGDPHNPLRGWTYAHFGWIYKKEHPDVAMNEKKIDYSDLDQDNVLWFQNKFYYVLFILMGLVVPMSVHLWLGDSLFDAYVIGYAMKTNAALHETGFVNSAAHMFGDRPYNDKIEPQDNYYVSLGSWGEGFHNYHHVFPWDYRSGESNSRINFTTKFINLMYLIGQADNLRTASDNLITNCKANTQENKRKVFYAGSFNQVVLAATAEDEDESISDQFVITGGSGDEDSANKSE